MYKFRDWIDKTRLTGVLSYNERAIEYFSNEKNNIYEVNYFKNNQKSWENILRINKKIWII